MISQTILHPGDYKHPISARNTAVEEQLQTFPAKRNENGLIGLKKNA